MAAILMTISFPTRRMLLCLSFGLLCGQLTRGFSFTSCPQRRSSGLASSAFAFCSPKENLVAVRSSIGPLDQERRRGITAQLYRRFPFLSGKESAANPLRRAAINDNLGSTQGKRDQLVSSLLAFGAVAGTSALSWLIEQGGTLLILASLKNLTGATTLLQVFETLSAWAADLGFSGFFLYAGALTLLQLAPVCNGILAAMAMGLMFGTVKGLAIMSISSTASAVVCLLLARNFGDAVMGGKAATPELFRAVADGISSSWRKTLLLVGLVRLSPVVPFCLSNYLFGLTSVEILPYAIGTWLGTLPGLFVWVSAGVVGKSFATGGASPPPVMIAVGVMSTVAVLGVLGKVSQAELAKISGAKAAGGTGGGGVSGGGEPGRSTV